MSKDSAVEFETRSRIHIGLAARDLSRTVRFYRTLFGTPPTKLRPGYAKFEVAEPPVNLSLNAYDGAVGPGDPVGHYGIQVKSTEAVQAVASRLTEAGIGIEIEDEVACCYAVQNKVWASDPAGNRWEVYVVLDETATVRQSSEDDCCADGVPNAEPVAQAALDEESCACCPECGPE